MDQIPEQAGRYRDPQDCRDLVRDDIDEDCDTVPKENQQNPDLGLERNSEKRIILRVCCIGWGCLVLLGPIGSDLVH